jgi:pyruvate dehydrogenase E2 component (dihydrolipoamide acetyltransferase)
MTYEFKLPDIGEGVVEGEVVRWLVKEGDSLREDQPMVEIMTDKATVEIPAPRAGRVAKRMYAEGQLCPVGKVLITIDLDGAAAAAPTATAAKPANAEPPAVGTAGTAVHATPAVNAAHAPGKSNGTRTASVLATPATRKLARDMGVDIREVAGTGPAGRITSDDVREHAGAGGAASAPGGAPRPAVVALHTPARETSDVRVPFRGVRKKIAENLVRSKHTAAHYTYVEEVDCTDLVTLRRRANERLAERGVKLSFLPFVIKATVAALQ